MKQHHEGGFTLLESLFVLSIFFLVVSLSILLLRPHHLLLEKQSFFSQLKADLFFAQHYALTTQMPVSVNIDPVKHYYYIKRYDGTLLEERYYSEEITMREGSMPLYIKFNANGNTNDFGSILIYMDDDLYRLTFLIGKGRFYVVKI